MGNVWICVKCGATATPGLTFGFQPFKNFPASPDCPRCFAKRTMTPRKKPKTNAVKLSLKPEHLQKKALCILGICTKKGRVKKQ